MTELDASDTFIRDVTGALANPWGKYENRISPSDDRTVASILDNGFVPLRIEYVPDAEYPSTVTVPDVEPVPISRELAASADAKPPLPYVSGGKLVGQRYYGDYCINPHKSQEIKVISPDVKPANCEVASSSAGSCTIL